MRAANHAASMSYDLLDRMVARAEPDLTSAWVYDAPSLVGGVQQTQAQIATACAAAHSCGELVEAYTLVQGTTNKDYDRTQQYDSLGRPSSQTITLNAVVYASGRSYDSWGRVLQQTSQHSTDAVKVFDFRYNAYGHLYRLERQGLPLWMATQEDQLGNVTVAALGNGLLDNAQFNLLTGRLNAAQLTNSAGTAQVQESYLYDPLGNATTRSEYWGSGASQQGFTETLQYDALNRLWTAQVAGSPLQTYTYDAAGNLQTKTGVGTGAYVYPPQGATAVRPHAVQSITGVTGTFSYDPNGNQLTSPYGRNQTWTSFDMPLVLAQGSNSSQFTYGPDHQRAKQIRSDGTTVWYAGAIEVEVSSAQTRVKTYWPQGLGLEVDAGGATQQYWMHKDRLGSVVAVSDINGTLQVQSGFDTWGLRRNLNGSAATTPIVETLDNKGFTGQEMLDQLALVHLNGRVYDPFVARFISADPDVTDPTNGQNYNRYSYVLNNPTNLIDPTGFVGIAAEAVGGAYSGECSGDNNSCAAKETSKDKQRGKANKSASKKKLKFIQLKNGKIIVEGSQEEIEDFIDAATGGPSPSYHLASAETAAPTAMAPSATEKGNAKTPSESSIASPAALAQARSTLGRYALRAAVADAIGGGPEEPVGDVVAGGILATGVVIAASQAMKPALDRMAKQIRGIVAAAAGAPESEQYALLAVRAGLYPDVRGGTVFLVPGDVWKYGKSNFGEGRYSTPYYNALGVRYETQFRGSEVGALMHEQFKLWSYYLEYGQLPPGNPRFK